MSLCAFHFLHLNWKVFFSHDLSLEQ